MKTKSNRNFFNKSSAELKKIVKETFIGGHDHFSFKDIQAFARTYSEEERSKYLSLEKHLSSCDRCKAIYDDIKDFDPYLNKNEPIPEDFWESVWEKISSDPFEDLYKKLEDSFNEAISSAKRDLENQLEECSLELENRDYFVNCYFEKLERVLSNCKNAIQSNLIEDISAIKDRNKLEVLHSLVDSP